MTKYFERFIIILAVSILNFLSHKFDKKMFVTNKTIRVIPNYYTDFLFYKF